MVEFTVIRRVLATLFLRIRQLWSSTGLTLKVSILVGLGLFTLMSAFGYLGISATEKSTRQTLQERVMLAQLASNHLDSTLFHLEQMLNDVASPQGPAGERLLLLDQGHTGLHAAYQQLGVVSRQVFLLDSQGQMVRAEPPSLMIQTATLASLSSLTETLTSGRFAVSKPVAWEEGREPLVLASVPVRDETGAIRGALVAVLDLTELAIGGFLPSVALGTTGYVDVVNQDGTVLLSSRSERLLQQSDHGRNLAAMIQEGKALGGACRDCHQTTWGEKPLPEVMAFAPLSRVMWAVVVRQPLDEAFATAQILQKEIVLLGLLAILIAGGLIWLTTRSVTVPLHALTKAALAMAQGDLSVSVALDRGDEIGALANTLNEMRARLRHSMEEIRAWNQELDRRVQEQTQAFVVAQSEAQQARDHLQTIIDSLSDELVVVDRNLHVRQVNAVVQERWNRPTPIIGQSCWSINHRGRPCHLPQSECPVLQVMQTAQPARVTHIRRNEQGEKRYVEIVASPLRDHNGEIREVVELMRDVTEERQVAQTLARRNEELSALNAVAATTSQSLNLPEILDTALAQVLELAKMDVGAIFVLDASSGELELRVHRERSPAGDCSQPSVAGSAQGSSLSEASPACQEVCSQTQVPLFAKGRMVGKLCVGTRSPHNFGPAEIGLLDAIAQQIAMAVENARLYAHVQHKEEMRGLLLKKAITAQEEERKRIARELHDATSQALTAIIMNSAALEQAIPEEYQDVRARLNTVRSLASQSLRELRTLIFDLRPEVLDDLGLALAIRGHAKERLEDIGIRAQVEVSGLPKRLPAELEISIFRLVQEAVTNTVRHAQASEARIRLSAAGGSLHVEVEDNGRGFDARRTVEMSSNGGWGLRGMAERVALAGGAFHVESKVGQGTRVVAEIPLVE